MRALHYATLCGNDKIVRVLIQHGSGCDDQDSLGETALIKASQNGQATVAKTLLERGADQCVMGGELYDVGSRTPNPNFKWIAEPKLYLGPMAVHHAASNGHDNLLKNFEFPHMKCEKREVSALHLGAMYGHTSVVQTLLAKGANIESRDNTGMTALHYASYNGHNAVIQLLLIGGCEINSNASQEYTALHFAAKAAKTETIRLLVTHGAAIDKTDSSGETPLHVAACVADANTVRALVECGASLEKQNHSGYTALEEPLIWDQPANAVALIELGAEWIRSGVFYMAGRSHEHSVAQILTSKFSTATAKQQRDAAAMAKRSMKENPIAKNGEVVRLFKSWVERELRLS